MGHGSYVNSALVARALLAAGAGVVRWTVAAFTTDPILLGFVQPLHGLTFALLHLACMRLIVEIVPVRLAVLAAAKIRA